MAKPDQVKRVPAELEGPVDRAVRTLFDTSWGKARSWIATGKITVAGAIVTDATERVPTGAEIVVNEAAPHARGHATGPTIGAPRAAGGAGARMTSGPTAPGGIGTIADDDIVFVDAQVVVVNKPPGVSTIPYEDETDTLDARVRAWLARRKTRVTVAGARPSLGVVHRLDKETSGLLVFTRTWLAKQALSNQFRAHTVHRRYLAIAHGDVPTRTIRSFILANRGDGLRGSTRGNVRSTKKGGEAREAITHLERLEKLPGATLLACRLETGRTHQIRIHLSELGHPLLGERVYVRRYPGLLLEAPRLMLHAAELGFVHPSTELPVRWERETPADMMRVLERLRSR